MVVWMHWERMRNCCIPVRYTRNWQRSKRLDHHIRVPALMIMAENDAVLPPSAADGMEKLVPDLEKYLVRDSGHWTQQEKPDEVSAKLIEWRKNHKAEVEARRRAVGLPV